MPIGGSSSARAGSKPKRHTCDICGKTFDSIEILNSHNRLDHSESGTS